MDVIVIAVKYLLSFPAVQVLLIAWVAVFCFICVLSISSATVPAKRLYKAGSDGAKKAPLSAIKKSFEENPEKWLLYEEEIFYVKTNALIGTSMKPYRVSTPAEKRRMKTAVTL